MNSITRRDFLRISSLTAAATLAAACTQPATPAAPPEGPAAPAAPATTAPAAPGEVARYSEAPALADLVKAGSLPPVEERVSKDPKVVPVQEEIGQYGGTWRRAFRGVSDYHAYGRVNYEPILRWPRDPRDAIQPGIASAWEFSEDGKVITLFLRKGIKWSDGAPFTVEDIIFWWEYIELDPELSINPHAEYMVNDEPMELEKVDDYTIRLKFDAPNGLILRMLAFHGNQWPLGFERFGFYAPKH